MEAIIISGKPAAGKTTVAQIIAERLHIKTIGGGDILKELALERGFLQELIDHGAIPSFSVPTQTQQDMMVKDALDSGRAAIARLRRGIK